MSFSEVACGPLPDLVDINISSKNVSGEVVYNVTQKSSLWPNGSIITFAFVDGSDDQKAVVQSVFDEYALWANVRFDRVEDTSTTNVRVTFQGSKVWSAVGTQALKLENKPTLVLGLLDAADPSQRGIVAHQVGHLLGLGHEWDGKHIQLSDAGDDEALAQHAERFAGKSVSNFAQLDQDSVMRYFLPVRATADGKGLPINTELSNMDKAWLLVNYFGRSPVSKGKKWNILQALDILRIPPGVAANILRSKTAEERRAYYSDYVASKWGSQAALGANARDEIALQIDSFNKQIGEPQQNPQVNGTTKGFLVQKFSATNFKETAENENPPPLGDEEADIQNIIGGLVLHPDFHSAVTKICEHDMVNHGVNLSSYPIKAPYTASGLPADAQQGILGILLPLLTQVAGSAMAGITPQHGIVAYGPGKPLPADVQQGIFDVVTGVFKNPVFKNVVTEIVKSVI